MIFQLRTFFQPTLALLGLCLASCGIWKKDIPPVVSAPYEVSAQPAATLPISQPAAAKVAQAEEKTWVFSVDSLRSKGKIDLSLDPKGTLLGAKPAHDTAPLKGHIHVTVMTDPSGKRSLKLKDVFLTNTAALTMPFHWSRLVGGIAVDIPVHVLKISKHSFHRRCFLNGDGTFSLPENFFTVMGSAKVAGSGLVLSKAVGARDVDLTIKKTEDVKVDGSLVVKNGIATLRIPSAVMRDTFDMEGSMLGLVFTGDITATARVR